MVIKRASRSDRELFLNNSTNMDNHTGGTVYSSANYSKKKKKKETQKKKRASAGMELTHGRLIVHSDRQSKMETRDSVPAA
jgi:hypothetical protein